MNVLSSFKLDGRKAVVTGGVQGLGKAIAPGYMKTAMTKQYWLGATPMKRPGLPKELGGAVVYLASNASGFMTGHVMVIDGGYTVW
jgi:hypothetical protein